MVKKQYSPEMKMQIVKEAMETGNASLVARRHDLAPSLVARWTRCYKRYGTFYPQKEASATNGSCNFFDYKKITKENDIAGEDRFFFVMPIIDVFDRCIVACHIGLSCEAKDVVFALKSALFKRQLYTQQQKPVFRSDNGPQFISNLFEKTCLEFGIEHERIPFKTPNLNAHIESFNAILEEECLSRYEFASYAEAYAIVADFIRFYNETRIHSATKYLPPLECYQLLKNNQVELKPVKV